MVAALVDDSAGSYGRHLLKRQRNQELWKLRRLVFPRPGVMLLQVSARRSVPERRAFEELPARRPFF